MPWPVLAFDIESIPDIEGLRLLRSIDPAVSPGEVYALEMAERKEAGKSDFMPLHLQRVLVISCVFRNAEGLRVHSFVDRETEGAARKARSSRASSARSRGTCRSS
jgi:predicted PolB exonuclease-like 3'-5' exonuclease